MKETISSDFDETSLKSKYFGDIQCSNALILVVANTLKYFVEIFIQ